MKKHTWILVVVLMLAAAGCSVRIDLGGATATPVPSPSPLPPAPTALPTALPNPTALPPTPTQAPLGLNSVLIYLIAPEDNGKSGMLVGCGDSAVPVSVAIEPTLGVLRAAYSELFKLYGKQYYGQSGLMNALYASNLSIESLAVENGTARVALKGSISLGGVCDTPRVEAQLRLTALQFSTVQDVFITLNGVPLKDALSLK